MGEGPTAAWDWKHTIVVFGHGDIPGIDDLEAAERAAVAVLKGDRSLGRGDIAAKSVYEAPSAYVDECINCGLPVSAHAHKHLACPPLAAVDERGRGR